VVKAIRNMDATRTTVTGRSTVEEVHSASSVRSKSSDTRQRMSITMKKRLIPMDILTDAKVNTSTAEL